jgi:hypothetical protein
MSQNLEIQLSEQAFGALERHAEAAGISPASLAAASLEEQFGSPKDSMSAVDRKAARARFERHFGEVDLGYPTGADNESIDRDLGREYADSHEIT